MYINEFRIRQKRQVHDNGQYLGRGTGPSKIQIHHLRYNKLPFLSADDHVGGIYINSRSGSFDGDSFSNTWSLYIDKKLVKSVKSSREPMGNTAVHEASSWSKFSASRCHQGNPSKRDISQCELMLSTAWDSGTLINAGLSPLRLRADQSGCYGLNITNMYILTRFDHIINWKMLELRSWDKSKNISQ